MDAENQNNSSPHTGLWRFLHFEYFRSRLGVLKIAQFFVCLIALIIMASVGNVTGLGFSSIEFFIFAFTVQWVCIGVVLLLELCNICSKLPAIITANIVMTVENLPVFLSLVIVAGIYFFVLRIIYSHSVHNSHHAHKPPVGHKVCCAVAAFISLVASAAAMGKFDFHDTVLAGGSFGLMAMLLFLFETLYYIRKCLRDGMLPVKASAGDANAAKEFSEPSEARY